MTEILGILIQLFIFLIIFTFPFKPEVLNNYLNLKRHKFNLIDSHALNIIFFLYVCLISSFLNIDIEILFKIYLIISVLYFFFFNKKNFIYKKENVILFYFFILIALSIFFYISNNLKLEWDGVSHWLEKAKIIFDKQNLSQLAYVNNKPHYPHLGSYVWGLFWKNSFLELEFLGRLIYVYIYLVSIFLVIETCKISNILKKIVLIFFILLLTFEPYYFGGYQEYLIFSILMIASRFILSLEFIEKKNLKIMFLIILILNLNLWVKEEGAIYYLLFGNVLILISKYSNFQKIYLTFFLFLLVISKFIMQNYFIGNFGYTHKISLDFILYDLKNYHIFFIKFYNILIHNFIAFVKHPLWILIFISIIFKLKLNYNFKTIEKYFIICLIINLIIFIAIFFTFNDLNLYLTVALDRLLFQSSGFYLVLILYFLNNLKFFKK